MSTTIRRMSMSVGLVAISATAIAANGDLDPSFGTGGFRLAGITDGISSIPTNMALQPDGKILICDGENSASSGQDFFIARFTADGGIDTSFSFDGHTTIDFSGGADICSGIAVQADGKIVVSGTTTPTAPGSSTDFAVARFNSDGTLDTATFGAGTGKAVYGFDLGGNNQDQALSLALKADGRIVLAGSAQTVSNGLDFAILQLLPDGTRDASFNLTGRVTVGFDFAASTSKTDQGTRVVVDEQGRVVVAGVADRSPTAGSDFAVIRLLPNGQLDPDFNADGRATIAFDLGGASGSNTDAAFGMTIDRDGRIVLSGLADSSSTTTTSNGDMAIARLLPDGSPDVTFGIGGKTTIAFDLTPNGADYGVSVIEQSNRKLLVAGFATGPASATSVAVIARLNADGSPDNGFGTVGKKTFDFGQSAPSGQVFNGIALQGSKIVLGGALLLGGPSLDLFVARVLDDLIFADGLD